MIKKRNLVSAAGAVLLCLLAYLQMRTWKRFDWHVFWVTTHQVRKVYIGLALAIVYLVVALRAVRWGIFLRPIRKTRVSRLIAPQFIGSTGVALLGTPGDMIRPYLIARKEDLTFSSQVAVWLVERIFDLGSMAILFALGGFVDDPLWANFESGGLHHGRTLQTSAEFSAGVFLAGVVVLTVGAVVLRRTGAAVASYLGRAIEPLSTKLAHGVNSKVLAFTEGLQTIHDFLSFVQLSFLSIVIWVLLGVIFWLVVHAYGGQAAQLGPASIVLLMVVSMFGSLVQLPVVGGGSQLASIVLLSKVLHIDNETAVSCAMLLWLVNYMSVIPAGLWMARREHVSLRALAAAEEKAEAALAE